MGTIVMQALLNNKPVPLQEITLDDLGWDHHFGEDLSALKNLQSLTILLTAEDLLFIGNRIFSFAQECIAEEPDYFEGEWCADIPQPANRSLFVEQPALLETYFHDGFWHREMIMAFFARMDTLVPSRPTTRRYWLKGFQRLLRNEKEVAVDFFAFIQESNA